MTRTAAIRGFACAGLTPPLYFKGDPFIANDPWAGRKPSLAIDLQPDGRLRRGVFDIVLGRAL